MAQFEFSDLDLNHLVDSKVADFLRYDSFSRPFVDSILDQLPVTIVLFLIEGSKEIPGFEETQTVPYLIIQAQTYIGSYEYMIDRSSLHLPDYLHLDWKKIKISKTMTLLSPSAIRRIIAGEPVTLLYHQETERPSRYLKPIEMTIGSENFSQETFSEHSSSQQAFSEHSSSQQAFSEHSSSQQTYILYPNEVEVNYEYSASIPSEVHLGRIKGLGVVINGDLEASTDSEEYYRGLN